MNREPIDVLAGVLRDSRGRLLICQRPPGKHLAGLWEFPGGKRDPGESRFDALSRELREELGIDVLDARPLTRIRHDDAAVAIRLDAWQVLRWRGEPAGLDGQAFAWVTPAELLSWPLAPADRHILAAARLPDRLAITPEPDPVHLDEFLRRLERLSASGVGLLQLRAKSLTDEALEALARQCYVMTERHAVDLMLNGAPALAARMGVGLHLPSNQLRRWHAGDVDAGADAWLSRASTTDTPPTDASSLSPPSRQARGWFAASCHDAGELTMAAEIGCDFALLSPVRETGSHPAATAIGWHGLAERVADSTLPVYALGGLRADDLDIAREQGARGVAGISAFWPSS